jgi:1-acyl-sn-glycerol-3-phosphate acyltransferase
MRLKFTRFLIRLLLRLLTHIRVVGKENVPEGGHFIMAANHLGLVDAFVPFYALQHTNLFLMVGEKWQKLPIMRWLGNRLDFVFIDRYNPDLKTLRLVMERMKRGDVLVITPEGTRSKVGHMIEGKPGASYLAAKAGYPIVPVGIYGSSDEVFFRQLRRLKRPNVTVKAGTPFRLPPLPKNGREAALQAYTDEIMCRIAALLPEEYRGFYADHPRLKELLAQSEPAPV